MVTTITARIAMLTTANFTTPAQNASITINVNTTDDVAVNDNLLIAADSYTITAIGTNQLTLTYNSANTGTVVPSGTAIQDSNGNQIYAIVSGNSNADFVWIYQAENYGITLCPGQATVIFDGSGSTLASIANDQLPSGFVGTYGWGRNWLANVDEQTFVASDLIGDPSGSIGLQFKDAILYMTENDLLNGGGAFSIPANFGTITAMIPLASLDTSLGIGPILVGTTESIFSVQAPTDRTTWQNLSYPIQSVALSGTGPVGPRNCCMVNSDLWFRSIDGVRSFIAARQDFGYTDGKTPQSFEVAPLLEQDDRNLLFYGSQINFDNRLFQTVSPYLTAVGVAHRGMVVLNLDPISTLHSTEPPVWETLDTGLKVLQLVKIDDGGIDRAFALVVNENDNNQIDLWEINAEGTGDLDDVSISETSVNLLSGLSFISSHLNFFGMQNGQTYVFVWGTTERLLQVEPGQELILNPGVGNTTIFVSDGSQLGIYYPILPSSGPVTAQLYKVTPPLLTYTQIQSWLETRRLPFGDGTYKNKLITLELYLDEITDDVTIKVYFRPDQYPNWILWDTVDVCANVKQCVFPANCAVFAQNNQTYAARLMLKRPPETDSGNVNLITNEPLDRFFELQIRFEITGHVRIRKAKVHAIPTVQKMEGEAQPATVCTTLSICEKNPYVYNSYGS